MQKKNTEKLYINKIEAFSDFYRNLQLCVLKKVRNNISFPL